MSSQHHSCLTWYGDLGLFLLGKSLISVPERLQLKLTGVARCLQFQQQQDVIPEARSKTPVGQLIDSCDTDPASFPGLPNAVYFSLCYKNNVRVVENKEVLLCWQLEC